MCVIWTGFSGYSCLFDVCTHYIHTMSSIRDITSLLVFKYYGKKFGKERQKFDKRECVRLTVLIPDPIKQGKVKKVRLSSQFSKERCAGRL